MAEVRESLLDRVTDAIRSGRVGKEVKRSARWFQDKIKGMKGDLRNKFSSTNAAKFYRDAEEKINPNIFKKRVSLGEIYCYHYNPKYRQTLPYYDMFPIVLPFEKHKNGFTGINFHYLPIYMRIKLLELLDAGYGDEDKGILNF